MDNMNYNKRNDEEIYAPEEYYKKQENNYSNVGIYSTNYGYSNRPQNNYDFLNDNNNYANNNNGLYFEDSRENKLDLGSKIMVVVVLLFVIGLAGIMFVLFAAKDKQDKEHKAQLLAYSKEQEKRKEKEENLNQEINDTILEVQENEEINNYQEYTVTTITPTNKQEDTNNTSDMRIESEADYLIEETGITGDFYDGTLTYSNKEYGFKCTVGNFFYELEPAYTWQSPYFSYYDCYNFAYERTGDRLDLYSIVMKDSDLYLDEIDKDLFINVILSMGKRYPEEYKYIKHSTEYLGNEELDCITLQFNNEQESMLKLYLKQYYNTILVISFNYAEENEERTQDIIDSFVFVDEYMTEDELYQLIEEKSKEVEFGEGWDK